MRVRKILKTMMDVTTMILMMKTIMMKRMIILKKERLVMMRRMTMAANIMKMTKILNSVHMSSSGRETLRKGTDFLSS